MKMCIVMLATSGLVINMQVLHTYQNGQTTTTLYSDGTKERDISNGTNSEFPESMDVKITNFCEGANCAWCHEKSSVRGKHGELQPTIDLIKQLPAGVEIACLVGDTMVLSGSGYVPIDTLCIGSEIYTSDGTLKKVVNISKTTRECVNVLASKGVSFICTPDHPFIVGGKIIHAEKLNGLALDKISHKIHSNYNHDTINISNNMVVASNNRWSRSGKIDGDFYKHSSRSKYLPSNVVLTQDIMFFYGIVVAEGSKKGISLHKNEVDIANRVGVIYNSMSANAGYAIYDNGESGINVEFKHTAFFNSVFFKEMSCGDGAHNKNLSFLYSVENSEFIRQALYGLFVGDGCFRKRHRIMKNGNKVYTFSINLKTVSKRLALDVIFFLENIFGVSASFYSGKSHDRYIGGRLLKSSKYYSVEINGKSNIDKIFPHIFSEDEDYMKIGTTKFSSYFGNDNIVVKSVEPVGIHDVYDITLEEDSTHVFVLSHGVLTHNCGGGHPMAHPEFDHFVKELSEHGIICNVTINEYHFKKELPRIERLIADKHVYGVGYSYNTIPCDWDYEHLVQHVIVGTTPYSKLEEITQTCKKVLLLGFKKHTGRGDVFYRKKNELVDANIRTWYAGLFHAARKAHLSFDNLAIAQLNPSRLFSKPEAYDEMFMGKDGAYSMYLDAVEQTYSISSTGVDKIPYTGDIREMFSHV